MTITRVLVAHDAGARSFENRGPGKGLLQLSSTDFEDGRRHVGEFEEDRPGRSFDRGGQGRHAYAAEQDAHEHAIEHFARELAKDLGRDYRSGAFAQLVLIAPPRFLGMLRGELDDLVGRTLIGTVAKDLPRATVNELCQQLEPYLAC
ncbi:MAG TPA: host attachment protein [Polyangiaceae bacterium]|nr:host attachment protein [Polyangiaceae bacterium]